MNYISPIRIIKQLTNETDIHYLDLNKVKKKIKIKVELLNQQNIQIKKQFYSLQEINKLIDTLKDERILKHHLYVFNTPSLLDFLELGKTKFLKENSEQIPLEHKVWLEPYIYYRLDDIIIERIKSKRVQKIKIKSESILLLLSADKIFQLPKVYGYLHNLIKELDQISNINQTTISNESKLIYQRFDTLFVSFLNSFPDLLMEVRDQIVECCLSIVINIEKFPDLHPLQKMYSQIARSLKSRKDLSKISFVLNVGANLKNSNTISLPTRIGIILSIIFLSAIGYYFRNREKEVKIEYKVKDGMMKFETKKIITK